LSPQDQDQDKEFALEFIIKQC